MTTCPCNSNKDYLSCCGVFINTEAAPATPEALMRSRYTAFTQANMDYIVKTMKDPAAKDFDPVDSANWAKQVKWLALEVVGSGVQEKQGWVEFIAHYAYEGKKLRLHEISNFLLDNGKWYYTDGKTPEQQLYTKIGRNDLCVCGSLKKYKKCCGK